MARIRTIKPEILEDEKTASLSDAAYRLFTAAIFLADDFGNLRADDRWLTAQIWWARREPPRVAELLYEIAEADLVTLYEVRGQRYMTITSWSKHQRIDNAGKPKVPAISEGSRIFAEDFRETPLIAGHSPRLLESGPEVAAGSGSGREEEGDAAANGGGEDAPSASLALVPGKPKRKRKLKHDPFDSELETVSAKLVLSKLSTWNGVKYTGTDEHIGLIRGLFRRGLSEMDLRAIVAFVAGPKGKGWATDEKMRQHLTPETLFGPKSHTRYLDAARSWAEKNGIALAVTPTNDSASVDATVDKPDPAEPETVQISMNGKMVTVPASGGGGW